MLLSDVKESLSVRKQEETGGDSLQASIEYELPDHRTITLSRAEIKDKFIAGDEERSFKGVVPMAG